MSRYLTPFKIGLLALTSLYCDAIVPTTATIPVLSFLVSHIIVPAAPDVPHTCDGSERRLQKLFGETLTAHASGIPGRTLWDLFLKKLWSINSFDALDDFFKSLHSHLIKPKRDSSRLSEPNVAQLGDKILLSRGSPLGVFVRRADLEYTRLQFDDAVRLWKNFLKLRQPTANEWSQRNTAIGPMSYDQNLQALAGTEQHPLVHALYGDLYTNSHGVGFEEMASMEDMERLLEFQVNQMQQTGTCMSDDMEKRLRAILKESTVAPSLAHYVRFLNAWRAGDYSSSLEYLHRYYDHCMQNKERTYYQYALLNMAMVQADFGCISEATAALNEAIAAAREHKDINCLNFCFSWLYHFEKINPAGVRGADVRGLLGSDREALAFLKARAESSKTPCLFSSTLLSEARLALSTCESISHALELVYKSSHINLSGRSNSVIGPQLLVQSSIFGRLGVSHLSEAYCDVLIHVYGSDNPREDVLRAHCRKANIMSQRGNHADALKYLGGEMSHYFRTLRHHQYLSAYIQYLEVRGFLHRYELDAAEATLFRLEKLPFSDPSLSFEIDILRTRYLILRQSYTKAFALVENIFAQQKDRVADVYQTIRLLLMKARLFAEVGRAEKGFSSAVRAVNIGVRAKIRPAIWEAVCALGTALNAIEEFQAAGELLDAVIPQAIEGEDTELIAELFSVHADAFMGWAGNEAPISEARRTKLNEVLLDLRHSSTSFDKLNDFRRVRQTLEKQELVLRLLGEDTAAITLSTKTDEYTAEVPVAGTADGSPFQMNLAEA